MFDSSPEAGALRREAAAEAARALHRLAHINVLHSSGPEAAAEFTRLLSDRISRLSFQAHFGPDGVSLVGIEHIGEQATGVVGVLLETPAAAEPAKPGDAGERGLH